MPSNLHAMLLLMLVACRPGPEEQAARTYLQQLDPLLLENSVLADEVLSTAAAVHGDGLPPEALEQKWSEHVVQLAVHLHHQAELVKPPEEWEERHAALVSHWGERAEAYELLAEALERADREQWDAARARSDKVKPLEEAWFRDVNADLVDLGLSIDQYP